jgi:hypothetical protein
LFKHDLWRLNLTCNPGIIKLYFIFLIHRTAPDLHIEIYFTIFWLQTKVVQIFELYSRFEYIQKKTIRGHCANPQRWPSGKGPRGPLALLSPKATRAGQPTCTRRVAHGHLAGVGRQPTAPASRHDRGRRAGMHGACDGGTQRAQRWWRVGAAVQRCEKGGSSGGTAAWRHDF